MNCSITLLTDLDRNASKVGQNGTYFCCRWMSSIERKYVVSTVTADLADADCFQPPLKLKSSRSARLTITGNVEQQFLEFP